MKKEITYEDHAGDIISICLDEETKTVNVSIINNDSQESTYVAFADASHLSDFIDELGILKEQLLRIKQSEVAEDPAETLVPQ